MEMVIHIMSDDKKTPKTASPSCVRGGVGVRRETAKPAASDTIIQTRSFVCFVIWRHRPSGHSGE